MGTARTVVLAGAAFAICYAAVGPARRFLDNTHPDTLARLDQTTLDFQQSARQGFPETRTTSAEYGAGIVHGLKWIGSAACLYAWDSKPHRDLAFMPDTPFLDIWRAEHNASVEGKRPPMYWPCDWKPADSRWAAERAARGASALRQDNPASLYQDPGDAPPSPQ